MMDFRALLSLFQLSIIYMIVKKLASTVSEKKYRWFSFQANEKIGRVPLADGWREKHQLFMRWKLLEAKVHSNYR